MRHFLRLNGPSPDRVVNASRRGILARARGFHVTRLNHVVKPFLLADIGEGIREVQIIQWFVQPGARVEQFDKICEVQSDKASVEITSRFDGVIKKLHYEADDMASVGNPLIDIDIQSELSEEDEALTTPPGQQAGDPQSAQQPQKAVEEAATTPLTGRPMHPRSEGNGAGQHPSYGKKGKAATLATPGVRHLTKEHNIDIADIEGTGRDGRVLKEDVHQHLASQSSATDSTSTSQPMTSSAGIPADSQIQLTPTQSAMFKTMTRSLSIPHFLYSDSVHIGPISKLHRSLNSQRTADDQSKLTLLPFVIKALSLAMNQHPILNARLDNAFSSSSPNDKPSLTLRGSHNIGFACDAPQGLIVPVIKSVQNHSIASIAREAARLSSLAREGKLTADDMTGGTFTVSNIGSVGGGVVSPVIVEGQMGIVGMGKSKVVPAFGENGELVQREEVVLSWSADHRLIDGATLARAAEHVKRLLEEPGKMLVEMR